jgi:tetratricopeptide (TPR) repeat protein
MIALFNNKKNLIHFQKKCYCRGYYLSLILISIFLNSFNLIIKAGSHFYYLNNSSLSPIQIKTVLQQIKTEAENQIVAQFGATNYNLLLAKFNQKYPIIEFPNPTGITNCPEFLYKPDDDTSKRIDQIVSQDGAYYVTGIEAVLLGHNSIAKWSFVNAAILLPSCPMILSNLGFVLNLEKDFKNARVILEYAISLDPDISSIWVNLGYCYKESGKYNEAIYAYRKAQQYNPEILEYTEILLSLYKEIGENDLADSIRMEIIFSYMNDHTIKDYLSNIDDNTLSSILNETNKFEIDFDVGNSENSGLSDAISILEDEKANEFNELVEKFPNSDPLLSIENEQSEYRNLTDEPELYDLLKNKLNNELSQFTNLNPDEYFCNKLGPYGKIYKDCKADPKLREYWEKKNFPPDLAVWTICFTTFCLPASDFCRDNELDYECPYCIACEITENQAKDLFDLYTRINNEDKSNIYWKY